MAFFSSFSFRTLKKQNGFTLIELIVVVVIIGTLFAALAFLFNPAAQLNKAQNARRQHDLEQVRTALATYYDDTGCYPTTLNFAQTFSLTGKTYMTTVPEDPKCTTRGVSCYIYQTDPTTSCPQWNVLYDTLAAPLPPNITCPLTSMSNSCVPTNYQQLGINYCVISGNIDCAKISVAITPSPPPGGSGGGGGSSGGNGVPTPTPTPAICGQYYACTGQGSNGCNVLDAQAEQGCVQNGGSVTCYCDSLCRVNGVSQCH